MEDKDILKMYDLVFQDFVKCYIEDKNYNYDEDIQNGIETDEEKLDLTDDEIKTIAYKMIYKNEYLWEIINDTIQMYIDDILEERGK